MTAPEASPTMRGFRVAVSARADYAVRALVALALEPPSQPMKSTTIAARQGIPSRFLANILPHLCRAGLVGSRRGGLGGYWLTRPASEITLADIVRALEPVSASQSVVQDGIEVVVPAAGNLLDVLRLSVQDRLVNVLESTTLLDVVREVG